MASYKGLWSWVLDLYAGGVIPCWPHSAATQLVSVYYHMVWRIQLHATTVAAYACRLQQTSICWVESFLPVPKHCSFSAVKFILRENSRKFTSSIYFLREYSRNVRSAKFHIWRQKFTLQLRGFSLFYVFFSSTVPASSKMYMLWRGSDGCENHMAPVCMQWSCHQVAGTCSGCLTRRHMSVM